MWQLPMDTAFLVTGELRLMDNALDSYLEIARSGHLFIATSAKYVESVKVLADAGANVCVGTKRELTNVEMEYLDRRPGLYQWLRFQEGIDLILDFESNTQTSFKRIKKLRTDYIFDDLSSYLCSTNEDSFEGILCNSDIIFSGKREYIIPLRGMFDACVYTFFDRGEDYFCFNPDQIRRSDDSLRWYWFSFPKAIFSESLSARRIRSEIFAYTDFLGKFVFRGGAYPGSE